MSRHIATLFRLELRALFSDRAIMLTLFGGILFYSFLYPRPYLQQLPQEVAVIVVNEDDSQLSRKLEFMVDATPQVALTAKANDLNEARQRLQAGEVSGILHIPRHFYRDLMLGKGVTVGYAGDASYFLLYGTLVEGLAQASGTLAAEIKIANLLAKGDALPQAEVAWSPISLTMVPLFNPTMGYINYVVPAVFVLILHQIMLMVSSMLGATQNQRSYHQERGYWQQASVVKLFVVRTVLLNALFVLPILYFFGFAFDHYHIPRQAKPAELWLFTLPFLLATSWLGIALGALFTRRDLPAQVILLSSLPLIFLAGFIWPVELIATPLNWLAQWFPSTPAIQGFLRLNQMGATFNQVIHYWWQLWGLALLYGAIAIWLLNWRQRHDSTGAAR